MISTRRDAARLALALASAGAGTIHLAFGPSHMSEWAVLGWGFYLSGALQLLWGLALVRRERFMVPGALASMLFVGAWLMSRTTGFPVGPERWRAEAVGRADLLCVGLELAAAFGALVLLRRPGAGRVPARRVTARGTVAAAALAVLASTGAAVAGPTHGHDHAPCPSAAVRSGVDANHDGADDGVQAYFRCQLLHEHDHHKGYKP